MICINPFPRLYQSVFINGNTSLLKLLMLVSRKLFDPFHKLILHFMTLLAGNPAYGRVTRPRVEIGASPLRSIIQRIIALDDQQNSNIALTNDEKCDKFEK